MPMWRCPHCGSPQPEAARCWVCHRSSTTCSTCRHFRRSLAATVSYCGLDPRRAKLTGTEHRGCWTEATRLPLGPVPDASEAGPVALPDPAVARLRPDSAVVRLRPDSAVSRLRAEKPGRRSPGVLEGFVPVELVDRGPRQLQPLDGPRTAAPPPPPAVIEAAESWVDRETLFGELDA